MARTIVIICTAVLLTWGAAQADIDKSKHDIPYYLGHDFLEVSSSEACTFCHHPTASEGVTGLVWDQPDPNVTPVQQFDVYFTEEGDETLICRSCHDGVALRDIFSQQGEEDHPVGFNYVEFSFNSRTYPYYDYKIGGIKGVASGQVYPMKNMIMQCTTCHDPHEGESRFVRHGNEVLHGSIICLDCHSCVSAGDDNCE